MQSLIVGAIAIIAGVLLGYWLGRGSAQAECRLLRERIDGLEREKSSQSADAKRMQDEITRLNGELGAANAHIAAEKQKYAQMQVDIEKAFGDLAAKALSANNQSFLTLAKQELGGQTTEAKGILEAKELAIKKLLDPLGVTLKNLDDQARAMEVQRTGAYAKVESLIATMQSTIPASLDALKSETAQLITALRAPKTRGNWGELQLKRCVEYAGMVQYCSFTEQVSARDEDDALLRPDMKIQLPNGRCIIVDAKTPLDAFLAAGESGDGYAQALRFAAHAETVKSHLRKLSAKTYWKQFDHTPEFVVCFLPSEALFSAALEADPSLIEFSAHANVVMATPTTLIALLKAIAYGWQQSTITQNAKAIQQTGNDLYNKLVKAHEYFEKLGNALKSAVGSYNSFIGSVEGRQGAFFQARKLGGLVHSSSELDVAAQLESEPRLLIAEDWTAQIQLPMGTETEEPVASE